MIKHKNETFDNTSILEKENLPDEKELIAEVLSTEKLFKDIEPYWKELEKRAETTIYMSYDWAYNWWKNFGKNKQRSLFLITIWDGTKLVGLAPFYKGYSKVGPIVIERRMQIIGSGGSPNEQYGYTDDYGISDFLDVIVDENYNEQVAEELINILNNGSLDVDVLTFHQLRDDSFIMRNVYPKLRQREIEHTIEETDTCPYIDLSNQSNMKEYIKDQKSSARRRIRQTRRAIGPDNEYIIKPVDSWKEVERATEKLIQLHQDRWNKIGFPGVFYDDRFTAFFKTLVKNAYNNNQLWFKEAVDEEGVCASRMVLKYQNSYYDYISGFDDECDSAKYRPGIGLLVNLVEESIQENKDSVELLRGEEKYKYDFTSENFSNWKLTVPLRSKNINVLLGINRVMAFLYKYIRREGQLLNVQRQQVGITKMIGKYFQFRWKSLQMKLSSSK